MSANPEVDQQPFIGHLIELRDRLLHMVLAVLILFLGLFYFANDIYTFVAEPLLKAMPEGTSMIATQVASPFLTPMKLSLAAAVFLAMPYLLYQLWAFIAPGLYQHEKKLAVPLLASSILLFYAGMAFAYFVVFPLIFKFLTSVAPEGVAVMTDISAYLDFVLALFFAFGLAFEVPIATILLVWVGATTPQKLAEKRPYIIVGAFIVGMFLTPPDIISQTLLALPMWVLFEVGVFFSRRFVRNKGEEGDDTQDESPEPEPTVPPTSPAGGHEDPDFEALSEEAMDAELDRIDAEDAALDAQDKAHIAEAHAVVDAKLEQVMALREAMDFDGARRLLHEVLVEGNESQVKVARNILAQMEDDD